jgi:hypothetical protein
MTKLPSWETLKFQFGAASMLVDAGPPPVSGVVARYGFLPLVRWMVTSVWEQERKPAHARLRVKEVGGGC